MFTRHLLAITAPLGGLSSVCYLRPRQLSPFLQELMLEEGRLVPANPSCQEGWQYHNVSCSHFHSYNLTSCQLSYHTLVSGGTQGKVSLSLPKALLRTRIRVRSRALAAFRGTFQFFGLIIDFSELYCIDLI